MRQHNGRRNVNNRRFNRNQYTRFNFVLLYDITRFNNNTDNSRNNNKRITSNINDRIAMDRRNENINNLPNFSCFTTRLAKDQIIARGTQVSVRRFRG